MTEPRDYGALFDEHRPLIEKLLAAIARRHGLRGDDAEDYASRAWMRLWQDDYAVLRKWRRESKLSTYLAVVLTNLAHEYRIQRDGRRWRPSAAALRLGPLAVALEKLVYHYGMRLDDAGEWLRTRSETGATDRELAELLGKLPARTPPSRARDAEPPLERLTDDGRADDRLLADEAAAEWRAVVAALMAAIARLPATEQVIVRMHFLEGHTLADVARALGVEQKPLYRVKDNALRTLRGSLLDAGVDPERVRGVLGGALALPDGSAGEADAAGGGPGKSGDARPSNETWNRNLSVQARTVADAGHSGRLDG